jgi:hypothetical protein
MDTFMNIFDVVFALLLGGLMIKIGYILRPKEFDDEPKKP